jgi:hypothetical protein
MRQVNGYLLSNMAVTRTDDGVVVSVERDHIVIKMKRGNKIKFFTKNTHFLLGDKCLVAFNLITGQVANVYPTGYVFDHKTDIDEEVIATKEELEVFEREGSRVQCFEGVSAVDGEIAQAQIEYHEYDPFPEVLEGECSRVQCFEYWG